MMTVIDGLTGSGKTYLMSRLLLKARKQGENVYANLSLNFPNENENVYRWHALSELYNLTNGTIGIDEGQKLFAARNWADLPMTFADKIASTRHEYLNIITTTQDFGHLDIIIRQNIHDRYSCQSLFRFPRSDRIKPIIQIVRIVHKQRSWSDLEGIKWLKAGTRTVYISKYWTKQLYDTFANINLSHFVCLIKRDKKKWLITLTSRQLSSRHR
jgi:hypothetical protein